MGSWANVELVQRGRANTVPRWDQFDEPNTGATEDGALPLPPLVFTGNRRSRRFGLRRPRPRPRLRPPLASDP
jgi:hypothetical protein